MGTLSEFLSRIYTTITVFFTLFLLELIILVRSVTGTVYGLDKRPMTVKKYLELIEEKIPSTPYKSEVKNKSSECSVCLSRFEDGEEIRKLQCKHTFHKDCLDRWLQQDWATCPLCRRNVLPEDVMIKYHQLRSQLEYDGSDEELILLLSAFHGNSLHRLL
ncbi:Zinc finger, RING-type [Dillenia turbinata]|uniref:Zinc finger, RING-type n=1 Tax=Dillenia turbinata TaxID=194707 RepID=A0AAN8Z474_9MAGN